MEMDTEVAVKRRTLETDEESEVSTAKRVRRSSSVEDLQIDLDDQEEHSLVIDGLHPATVDSLKTEESKAGSSSVNDEDTPTTSAGIRDMVNKFPIRGSNGRITFVRQHGRRVLDDVVDSSNPNVRPSLLNKPFWDLFREAEEELTRIREAPVSHLDTSRDDIALPEGFQDVEQTRPGARKKDNGEDDADGEDAARVGKSGQGDDNRPSLLWTDKYRPRGFMDLLSDTAINRLLLQWVKLWDECVFNRPINIKTIREKAKETNDTESRFKKKEFVPRNQFIPELNTELDKWRRPMQSVILLAGPPGLGKTTLAHVLARHCGYNVVELNASDDRSPEAFRSALEGATQMKAVLDRECRPNCLVIDEIDGAPIQSINVLLQMLKPSESDGSESASEKKKKKKQKVLVRPVICICNEPWGPALRQLRQTALMLQLPQTQPHRIEVLDSRLVVRLQDILRRERMKCDPSALQALSEKTGNDIRSCLSTLQFLQARKGGTGMISVTDVAGVSVGDKDTNHSLGNVIRGVFSKPRNDGSNSSTTSILGRQRSAPTVLMLAQSFGDYERLNQGLFDTLTARPGNGSDITEQLPVGLDWLCFADQLQETTQRMQHYALMAYGPFAAQKWQGLFATFKPVKAVMNNSFAEFRQRQLRLSNHWASLLSFISPAFLAYHSGVSLLVDVMPFILGIIQPQMRSSNVQLLSEADRLAFRSAVTVMASFGLVYQQRMIEGQYVFQLEPNLEELVRFPGIASFFAPLTYATKMMFSREIELNKIRQANEVVSKGTRKKSPEVSSGNKTKRRIDMKDVEKPRKDFFGRLIQPTAKPESNAETPDKPTDGHSENDASGIYYKFKEGFSNAVRRKIKIKQIL